MTEKNPAENRATDELSTNEFSSVVGGTDKTPAKPDSPKETVTFEYGRLAVQYGQQKPD
jgi:hypothetical protein